MSSNLVYDSDDERGDFDIERREITEFQRNLLSASIESSDDDDEGIIDGTKIPSSTKLKTRAKYTFLDVSTSSMSNGEQTDDDDDGLERNPFEILSKSIPIENDKPMKKKKSLGVPKTRRISDANDIYDQDQDEDTKSKVRKPTKAAILETERKMQQLSRSEQLVLPTFTPKPLETWQALEKRSRQELMNEIRAQNPSFTPQDPELPELPQVEPVESTAASTLSELVKLTEDKPAPTKLDKLSRFLNPEILKKKPTISNLNQQSSDTLIDLTDTKKMPTVKPNVNISFDSVKSPSSSKRLFEIQKQLGMRMQAKRAAMLADHNPQLPRDDDEEEEKSEDEKEESDDDDDSMDIAEDDQEEKLSDIEDEEKEISELSTDEEILEDEQEEEEVPEQTTDSNRPSLKTILTRLESSSEPAQIQPPEPVGQTEWFDSARPAQIDSELEMLCSGAFGGDNIIPLSQNIHRQEPVVFSPLPPTQNDDDDIEISRPKVRQLVDDDDEEEEEEDSNEQQVNSGETEEEIDDENEELIDYRKQLFEMEAEESESDDEGNPTKKKDEDEEESEEDDDDEPDEELQKFIDTAAVEMDEDEVDDLAKVHLKMKAKEDEHQLKLLKEQYLDFDGDDDGRRIKISKNHDEYDEDDDDPDYNSENEDDEDDDEEEQDTEQANFVNRLNDLERQRSLQDTQAEELHLDEDLGNIGQHSSMFQKGLALKQKRIQSTTTSHTEITTDSNAKKARSVTLSSSLLAKRFSSTLLAPINRNMVSISNSNNSNETTITTKKQHNPRRHVFTTNENQNPAQTSGEKRANSADKSPKTNTKRFKQSTALITKSKETTTTTTTTTTTSVFSALAFSHPKP